MLDLIEIVVCVFGEVINIVFVGYLIKIFFGFGVV